VLDESVTHVVDGGFLLHRVVWPLKLKYGDILEMYVNYVKRHYGCNCVVVFDGYTNSDLMIKNQERRRRQNMIKSTDILIQETMDILISQQTFLSNDNNKMRLISILTDKLVESGINVLQAEDDADTLIVRTAIEKSIGNTKVVVIGEDVDLIILLMTLTPDDCQVILKKPGKGSTETRLYSIQHLRQQYKNELPYLLFIHAIGGCDTTSAIFQQGKLKHFKTVQAHPELNDSLLVFNNESSTPEAILRAGEEYLLKLYKAPANVKSLNQYRYEIFRKIVASSKQQVKLSRLPPTIVAAKEHLFRVYLQVQLWMGKKHNLLDWGWEKQYKQIIPVFTKKPPATESLLSNISCACTQSCEKNYGCRKAGMRCSTICKNCQGTSCLNQQPICDEDDDNDDRLLYPDLDEEIENSDETLLQCKRKKSAL